ncbi:MAG TPA: galactose oxidase early set domain-containing protein, partial [Miltoncostaea sp.]|nr:galactose oxidase early set domain-containing protein [Miltoncostaea sp.]
FRVAVDGDPSRIAGAALVRPMAVTHSVDMAGGTTRLDVTVQGDGLTLTTPRDGSVAPPGWYMLFVLDDAGVPSVASWVRVAADAPDAPALPVAQGPTPTTPAPPATPPAPFRVRTLTASLAGRGPRLVLSVRLKATEAASARVAVLRGRRGVTARTVPLSAGRLATSRIAVRRGALGGARTVTLRFRITHGGRVTTADRTLRVPPAR